MLNVHEGIGPPLDCLPEDARTMSGNYKYYHYRIDGIDDVGWGCGYRTLQSMCSWIILNKKGKSLSLDEVPSINQVQKVLADVGDKSQNFIGSKEWIGTYEAFIVLDTLFQVSCKIRHIHSGLKLLNLVQEINLHFQRYGSLIMMGGDKDCSSKGILGICSSRTSGKTYLLILDPHYSGPEIGRLQLQHEGWVSWKDLDAFEEGSFYNLCFPL